MLKRLKQKIDKRSRSAKNPQPAPDVNASSSKTFGLFFVAGNVESRLGREQYPVDIIAIHGLNGDAFTTWTHANGKMWIRDLLPNFLPGCRVYTYGYPSKVFCNSSLSRVQEYSKGLLSSVRDLYDDPDTGARPIIFICHSLGGIVCKQALVFAHEDDTNYGALLKSVIGIAFLGTPHRGSYVASLGSIVGSIVNCFMLTTSTDGQSAMVRTDLLNHLNYDSSVLQDLFLSSRNRLQNMAVVSFYETEPTPPLSSLIVDRTSSILGIPREDIIPLYENHRDMCRFSGETESYKTVSRALRRIASQSHGVRQTFERPSTHSSERSFSDIEKACMALFSVFDIADYKRLLPKPVRGTCQWIMGHPVFRSWLEKEENSLLWLTGHPGCGKTVLSYSLARSFEELKTSHTSRHVLVYFCDDKVNNQKDAKSILISLIFQIVRRHRSLVRHVRKVFDIQGPSVLQSFSSLWGIFLRILNDPKSGLLYVIIDALDECERVSCHQLLESIYELVGVSGQSTGSGNHIKFLLTSRPSLELTYTDISQAPYQISIDEGQPGYYEDLRIFIQQRVEEIALKRKYSAEVKDFLLQALYSRADQTFLWIHMVLASVENSLLSSIMDFRDIIARIPPTLETTYLDFLSAIPVDHQEMALRLLKLVLASSRPLYLNEINVAFTIDSSHQSAEDVNRDCQNAMAHTIQGMLGPFARVLESKVSLVHQSAKDFLLRNDYIHKSPAMLHTIDTESAALQMSFACVRYLLLNDFSGDLFSMESSPIESIFEPSTLPPFDVGETSSEDDIDLNTGMFFREPSVHDAETSQSIAARYALYSYASLHWAEHLALCEASAPDWLRDAAKALLDVNVGHCRNWLHFYWSEAAANVEDDPMNFDRLVLAAYFNLHETLKDLINYKPPQELKDQALFWASRAGHSRIVTTLLEAGADPGARGGSSMQFALTIAAENGRLACVVALLADERTDVNIRGRNGRTALSFACSNGLHAIAKAFLDHPRCDPNQPDHTGATPLFWAAGGAHTAIVTALAARPDVALNHRDNAGRTVVSWAAGDGTDEILKHLLKLRDIDPDIHDDKGRSPLSWAAGNGHAAAAHALLLHHHHHRRQRQRRGETIDDMAMAIAADRDRDGRNPVSWACGGGHLEALRVLLLHMRRTSSSGGDGGGGGGVDDADADGWAPLAWAVHRDAPGVVEALAATGAVDLDRRDGGGRTALSWAAEYGHARVVRALLREGADPGPVGEEAEGPAPVAVARRYGRADLVLEIEGGASRESW
ncbi:hypothetical protein F5X96DRAFT_670791 [Biscogniauxia mediterranea]|nr:hypothetical protein F5X96DRAFT_670791 [Biscogniauxia mediterranea]